VLWVHRHSGRLCWSVTALVAPHLEGDQLKGKVTFSNVDLLRLLRRA
jgi:hypothetical protein